MVELILIRHGETAWNLERRLQGNVDIPLNATGLQQAMALANALDNEPLDAIISSDLQRAIQTANALAASRSIQRETDPQWRERSFGGFEGHLIDSIEEHFPAEYAAWRSYQVDSPFPVNPDTQTRGETVRQFHQRIAGALVNLARQRAGQKVAVVAHGGVLECAWRIAHRLPLHAARETAMKNASINRFALRIENGEPVLDLQLWGDVRHLDSTLDEIGR